MTPYPRFYRVRPLAGVLAIFLSLASCGLVDHRPGPDSIAAAKSIAAEISAYRATTDFGTELASPALTTFARVVERVRRDYLRPVKVTDLLAAARKGLRDAYPQPKGVADDKLVMAAIDGMLQSLDKYSTYLDPTELKAMRDRIRGQFGGLGIKVRKHDQGLLVVTSIDDTPAFRAGIKSGDIITQADDRELTKLSLGAAVRLLRGPAGAPIALTIERKDSAPILVSLVREIIRIEGVRWRIERDVGYIRISEFTRRVGERVESAVEEIRYKRGNKLRGFVLDLRNNPGGPFDEAVIISDAFLEDGRIVSTKSRHNEEHHTAEAGDIADGLPIVVIINQGSASASEIVAGALRDQGRAILLGNRSFGKGTVQRLIPLSGDDALRLTTAIYLTPSGKSVDGGVKPDTIVNVDPDREGDEQLERAIETVWELFRLRP